MSDPVGSTLQVVVVGLVSILVVVVLAVYQGFSLLSAARYLSTVATDGANDVEGIAASAIAQCNSISQGSENTLNTIVNDVTSAVLAGVQLIFGTVQSLGQGILDSVADGASAIESILVELQQNLSSTFYNIITPLQQTALMFGNVFLDVISALQSAFGPFEAIINGTLLLACCIAQAIENFPGGPSGTLPGKCPDGTCSCLCTACSTECNGACNVSGSCVPGALCDCPGGAGGTRCCLSLF